VPKSLVLEAFSSKEQYQLRNLQICFTLHHFLDVNAGAAGALMALVTELEKLGCGVRIISFDDMSGMLRLLPEKVSRRIGSLVFPLFVVWKVFPRRHKYDVIDCLSSDGSVLFYLMKKSKKRPILVSHSQGLEQSYENSLGRLKNNLTNQARHFGF
jgi:hypothetical protein